MCAMRRIGDTAGCDILCAMETRTYQGSCHCGAVQFEVSTELMKVIDCNCSRCSRTGAVLTFVPTSQFKLHQGEADLTEYRFNTKVIAHLFCKHCGIQPIARGKMPDGTPIVAINLRCVPEIDVTKLTVHHYDGKNL